MADEYIPTDRGLEALRRIAAAGARGSGPRAFAITGPYGSGKSSFGVFLDALMGPSASAATAAAWRELSALDSSLAASLRGSLHEVGAESTGLFRATATAQREPVSLTIARALQHGAQRFWKRGGPRALRAAIAAASEAPLSARELAQLVAGVSEVAPVLLVLDEFGKNLEHFADTGVGDLFVLQQLAERFASDTGAAGLLVTFQHVAFEQYATTAEASQRREWIKVQGRFEEISFVNDLEHSTALVAKALDHDLSDATFSRRLDEWTRARFQECRDLGLVPQLVSDESQVRDCYPLNPVCTVVLAELCQRFGQHDRTLFSFLSSGEPGSLPDYLHSTSLPSGDLPAVDVASIWDYFLGSSATAISGSTEGSRWLEINARVRDVRGLSALQVRCAKAVGVLNLVGRGGSLRASPLVVAEALGITNDHERGQVATALGSLEAAGVLVYRQFADEYRVWQGTDFDIRGHLEVVRSGLRNEAVHELLARVQPLRPVVASRHSQQTGLLRYFEVRFLGEGEVVSSPASADADGLLVIALTEERPRLKVLDDRPLVCLQMPSSGTLQSAALEAAAALELLSSADQLAIDWVARREIQELAAISGETVRAELTELLAQSPQAWWVGHRKKLPSERNLSRLLSAVCDVAYSKSPHVKNEMIARRELTSQGAKARRQLLEAMFTAGDQERLGLGTGFGPERAMYEAVLRHPRMHVETSAGWRFAAPPASDSWRPAWDAITAALEAAGSDGLSFLDLHNALAAPPVGLKAGPILVLLAAYMLVNADEVAVYDEGTFQPILSPHLLNRLVKSPDRFHAKLIVTRGQRALVADRLLRAGGGTPLRSRNATILQALGPLLSAVRGLPAYALRTTEIGADATRVRRALQDNTDPAYLLFDALPEACELPTVGPEAGEDEAAADLLVNRIQAAVEELQRAYPRMLDEAVDAIATAFGMVPSLGELRAELRAHCRPLERKVLDRGLAPFIQLALNTSIEDDVDWLEAVLLNVVGTPPESWTDVDLRRLSVRISDLAGTFRRVRALHYGTEESTERGFEARRVTITAPDGSEIDDLHWIDDGVRDLVLEQADQVLASLTEVVGPRALTALITALAIRASERRPGTWRDAPTTEETTEEASA